jgi:hypothetical protein
VHEAPSGQAVPGHRAANLLCRPKHVGLGIALPTETGHKANEPQYKEHDGRDPQHVHCKSHTGEDESEDE